MRKAMLSLVLALALTGCTTTPRDSPTTNSPSPSPTVTSLPQASDFVIAPGRIGDVKAGMSFDDAVATGYLYDVSTDSQDVPSRTLGWKPPLSDSFTVTTNADGSILDLGVSAAGATTADGLGVGSTLSDVTAVYETAEMYQTPDGGTGVYVSDGENWMAFGFSEPMNSVGQSSTIVFIEVTSADKPDLKPLTNS